MNYYLFILKSALEDFQRNKVRTFLTSLGILIGISSVVLLMALGLGLKRYISQQFESLGTGLIYVMPGDVTSGGVRGAATSGAKFDDKDVTSLKKIPQISYVLPFVVKMVKAEANGNSLTVELTGSTADVFPGLNVEAEFGSLWTKSDLEKASKKVVLGSKVSEKLFGTSAEGVGKIVKLDGQAFTVSGVAKAKGGGGFGAPSIDEHVYANYRGLQQAFGQDKKYYAIYIKAESDIAIVPVKEEAKKILAKRYKSDEFSVIEQTELLNTIDSIFSVINSILIAIAAISLVVGGIGIMNIMYVSVIERIREIGIRRAIGATAQDILMQFLAESVLLSMLGGALGLTISFLVVLLIQSQFPAYIDVSSVILAVGVSSAIGIVFGVFPARKAANMSPIDAIRSE